MIETKEGVIFYFIVLFFVGSWETNCWEELDEGKSHINRSEVLISHILHFLFSPIQFWFLSSFAVRLPGASIRVERWAGFQREGLFSVTFIHFYTPETRIFLAEQEDWLMSCFPLVSLQAPIFFNWQVRDGVINNIFSLYLVIRSFVTQLILWDVKKPFNVKFFFSIEARFYFC